VGGAAGLQRWQGKKDDRLQRVITKREGKAKTMGAVTDIGDNDNRGNRDKFSEGQQPGLNVAGTSSLLHDVLRPQTLDCATYSSGMGATTVQEEKTLPMSQARAQVRGFNATRKTTA
jgi:hypothetical protein